MKAKAAIYDGSGTPVVKINDVDLAPPRAHEILVRIISVGICHTDLGMMSPASMVPPPIVLGHEGAGVVEDIGSDVTEFSIGDSVVLSIDHCGKCPSCHEENPAYCEEMLIRHFSGGRPDGSSPISLNGSRINGNFFAQSSFANYAIAPASAAVKISADVPLELMGPLGCGIQTGAGTVFNICKPKTGEGIAVFGVGTVGLSAIMAAKVAKCHPIIAVDINPERLELAKELGADVVINGAEQDTLQIIKDETNQRGVEYSFDTSGVIDVIKQAFASLYKNGLCVLAVAYEDIPINGVDLIMGKTIRGTLEGESNPKVFIPYLIDLYKKGELPIDKLVKFYPFEDINKALDDALKGETIKPILMMPSY